MGARIRALSLISRSFIWVIIRFDFATDGNHMKIIFAIIIALFSIGPVTASTSEKAMLQAAMQRYLDSQLVDGAILDLDLKSGEIRKLYPIESHPMILTLGENFVLCATLSDVEGNKSTIDYYFAPRGDSYIMFRAEIDNRKPLRKLMKAGTVKRFR